MSRGSKWESYLVIVMVMYLAHFVDALQLQHPNSTSFRSKRQSEYIAHFADALQLQHPNTTSIRSKRQSECNRDEFKCNNGQCIPRLSLCDAERSCVDGSDEIFEQCRSIECPESRFTFRCDYGACITRSLRCNGKRDCKDGSDEVDCSRQDGCYLPEHMQYGNFSLSSASQYTPKQLVPSSTTIYLFCSKADHPPQFFYCHKNIWRPSLQGVKCPKPGTCPTLRTSASEEVSCKLDNQPISCVEPASNSTVRIRCQPFHTFDGNRPIYRCENGNWDQTIISCHPDCGIKSVAATTLIIEGQETVKNEYPWVAAIYNATNHQICGGTIISRFYVLSAAHCFSTSEGKANNKDDYTITTGKYHRDINVQEKSVQKRKIKTLYIHEDYRGRLHKFRDDIALIELDRSLSISLETQPVCIDWESNYEDFDFIDGNEGVVAGWGNTKPTGIPSNVLKKLIVPFRGRNTCFKDLPADFRDEYYTSDKICAGYKDENANVCSGDSGSGLCFRSDGRKYFVRGIVSVAVKSEVGCDANNYALYTRVSKYLSWLEAKTRRIL